MTHGTISAYQSGCRCDDCTATARTRRQAHRRAHAPVDGARVYEVRGALRVLTPSLCPFCGEFFYCLGRHERLCARSTPCA